jgi:hypothetical protein
MEDRICTILAWIGLILMYSPFIFLGIMAIYDIVAFVIDYIQNAPGVRGF